MAFDYEKWYNGLSDEDRLGINKLQQMFTAGARKRRQAQQELAKDPADQLKDGFKICKRPVGLDLFGNPVYREDLKFLEQDKQAGREYVRAIMEEGSRSSTGPK